MGISLRMGAGLRDRGGIPRGFWTSSTYLADGYRPAFVRDRRNVALPAYGANLASGVATQSVTTVAGKLYELSATGSGSITIAVGTAASGTNILAAATYATARYFTAVGTTTHLTVTVSSGSLTTLLVREVMLGEMGTNLGASGYTMSVNGGTGTATESPTGQLNLTGDGTNPATADKQLTGLTVGRHYRIVFLSTTNPPAIFVGTSQGGTQTVPTTTPAVGVTILSFTATATTHWVRFQRSAASLSTITSITIAEWTPGPTLRNATFAEAYAFTASSTTARTYVGSDGLIKNDLSADQPRFTWNSTRGKWELLLENASTNLVLWSRDLTNAAWTKSNMTTAQTATGADGVANSATTLTATVGNATALQAITSASSARITGCRIKRRTGSGNIQLTQDNGSTWTTVTVTNDWTRVSIASVTSANPTVGIRIVTSGDAVDVDYFQHEAQSFLSSDIPTTSATVTRAIETCRYRPLVEAVIGLPGTTVKVQATIIRPFGTAPRIVGGSSGVGLITIFSGNNTEMSTWNGSVELRSVLGSGLNSSPVGVAATGDSSGRSISSNGGTVASDTNSLKGPATQFYLGRDNSGGTNTGDGRYYTDIIWPFRATDATIQSLSAVPT